MLCCFCPCTNFIFSVTSAQFLECCKCALMTSAVPSPLMFRSSKVRTHLFSSLAQLLAENAIMTQTNSHMTESCPLTAPESLVFLSGDAITRRHTVEMSEQNRDQLAKAIYGRLFSYLVNTANGYLQGQDDLLGYAWMCACVTTLWVIRDEALGQ